MNIGSEEMVTINQLAGMVMEIAGKRLSIKHIRGPLGVSTPPDLDNRLIQERLGWAPSKPLRAGLEHMPGSKARCALRVRLFSPSACCRRKPIHW